MTLPETDTDSSGLYQGMEECTVSSLVLPLTATVLPRNPGIPMFGGNPSSYIRDAGNGSTPST